MSSNELFSDESGTPAPQRASTASKRPSGRNLGVKGRGLGVKGVGRLIFGLILLIGTFAGLTAEAVLTAAPASAATAPTPAPRRHPVARPPPSTPVSPTPSPWSCYGVSGVSGTTAYPASITLNTGTLPPGSTQGTTTSSSPACTTSTSGSGTTEHYILTCPITDNPDAGPDRQLPGHLHGQPRDRRRVQRTTSGTLTHHRGQHHPGLHRPRLGGTAQKFVEGYANTYMVECENETHVSGQAQYPSSIAITSGSGPPTPR